MATNPYNQYGTTAPLNPNLYNPYAPPVMQPMPYNFQPQQRQQDMIWIRGGEAGANAYQMAPNTRVVLWDQDNPVIYIKSADSNGVTSMKTLDYTERGSEKPQTPVIEQTTEYITKADFESLKDSFQRQINRLNSQINNMRNKGGNDNG